MSLNQTKSHGRAPLTLIWSQQLGTGSCAGTQRRQQSGLSTRNSAKRCGPLVDLLGGAFGKFPRSLIDKNHHAVWGSNFSIVKEELDLVLKKDFSSFIQIKEATDVNNIHPRESEADVHRKEKTLV